MPEGVNGDTEGLRLMQELERAIATKQLGLSAALSEQERAKERYSTACHNLATISRQITDLETAVHLKVGGAYLNGESLDRGVLTLGNESLRFSGWQGKVAIPLKEVREVEVATSLLSPLAGFPLVGGIWLGKPRPGYSLLINVNDGTPAGALMVVADLREAAQWPAEVRARQQGLEEIARRRAELLAAQERAEEEVQAAGAALTVAHGELCAVKRELSELRRLRDRLQAQQRRAEAFRKKLRARLQAQQRKAETARQRAAERRRLKLLRREMSYEQEAQQPDAEMP